MDIKAFKGLNNVTDPLRAGVLWQSRADNIDIDQTGAVQSRDGYTLVSSGTYSGIYSTIDFTRAYLVDGGSLKTIEGVVLKTGLSTDQMQWAEVNDHVYFSNGKDSGVITPDNTVLPWAWVQPVQPDVRAVTGSLAAGQYRVCVTYSLPDGRMTGSSEASHLVLDGTQALQITGIVQVSGYTANVFISPADSTVFQYAGSPTSTAMTWNSSPDNLGFDLQTQLLNPLPSGVGVLEAWRGRIYAAQYFPELDQSVVWFSEPLAYHLFNPNSGFFMVPGNAVLLTAVDKALVVGTTQRVYAYDGLNLSELAPYGVVPGWHDSRDDEQVLFWTTRGLCSALPFTNLTERHVSVAPGLQAGGTIVRSGGQKRYVVAIQEGGAAFNSYP